MISQSTLTALGITDLGDNSSLYPEYTESQDSGIYPSKKVKHMGGWFITGSSSNRQSNRWKYD